MKTLHLLILTLIVSSNIFSCEKFKKSTLNKNVLTIITFKPTKLNTIHEETNNINLDEGLTLEMYPMLNKVTKDFYAIFVKDDKDLPKSLVCVFQSYHRLFAKSENFKTYNINEKAEIIFAYLSLVKASLLYKDITQIKNLINEFKDIIQDFKNCQDLEPKLIISLEKELKALNKLYKELYD